MAVLTLSQLKCSPLLIIWLSIIWCTGSAAGNYVEVDPTWSSCSTNYDVDKQPSTAVSSALSAILNNVSSNSVLLLKPGCHFMDSLVTVTDKTNVTIKAVQSNDDVVIHCNYSMVGLVFVNMSRLTLQDITVSGCGLGGENLKATLELTEKDYLPSFESVFQYTAFDIRIAVFIIQSHDVTMNSVEVMRNHGFGIVGVNIIGSFVIELSTFAKNYNEIHGPCFSSIKYGLGGGVFILYQDREPSDPQVEAMSTLTIKDTRFMYNSNCQLDSQMFPFSPLLYLNMFAQRTPFTLSGGGGLTVYLANAQYPVSVNVVGSYFMNNTAIAGGGMLLGAFAGINNSTINIIDSVFSKNGLVTTFDDAHRTVGEGLMIVKDIPFPSESIPNAVGGVNTYVIKNCTFKENTATGAAGVAFLSRYRSVGYFLKSDRVYFENCNFIDNKAYASTAMYLEESKSNGFQIGVIFYITDTNFIGNEGLTTHFTLSSQSISTLNILGTSAVRVVMKGKNQFLHNNLGTPIALKNSVLDVSGELYFTNNTGNSGGGIAIVLSYIIINGNTSVLFQGNRAYLQGGAIFSLLADPLFGFDCYLFFDKIVPFCSEDHPCPDPRNLNISILFENNIASISNVAFGSTLNNCPWKEMLLNDSYDLHNSTNTFRILEAVGVFTFTPPLDADSLSTPPIRLTTNVTNYTDPVMLGQQVTVQILSYDEFGQQTPDPISSAVLDNTIDGMDDSRLGNGSYWFTSRNRFIDVPVSIRSRMQVTDTRQVQVGVYSIKSSAGTIFNMTIAECYDGFDFTSSSDNSNEYETCECNSIIKEYTSCFETNATIIVPDDYWLGKLNPKKQTNTSNPNQKDFWIFQRCLFDYCRSGDKVIVKGQFDDQCNEGYYRTGILCGECQPGYSEQLGINKCAKCSNYWLFIFPYYMIESFFIILGIGKWGITVSHGYINSLFFFANIVVQFQSSFISDSSLVYLFYPISILNSGLGFPACLYDGMTALQKGYLRFVFPAFLYVLVFFYIIIIRRCQGAFRGWIANPAQVFATVILMTYISLLQACINNLSCITLQHLPGKSISLRWTADPNIVYFHGKHIPLGLLSLGVLVFYLIPSTLLLLFPSLALRTPIGKRFIPIYDAFWAPFRENFRFWIGFRLILRVIPLGLVGYVQHPLNIYLLEIFVIFYMFLQIVARPFVKDSQNFLENYLSLCLLVMASGSLYRDEQSASDEFYIFYVIATFMLIYSAITFVVGYHLYIKVKCLQEATACLKHFFKRKCSSSRRITSVNVNDIEDSIDANEPTTQIKPVKEQNMTQLREPLLDDEYTKIPP